MLMEMTLQSIVDEAAASIGVSTPMIHAPIHTLPDGEARHRKKILTQLHEHPFPESDKSLHIGVAGYFNFDIIAKSRPNYVLLLDSNDNQTRFWRELFAIIKKNETVDAFAGALTHRTAPSGFVCEDGSVLPKRLGSDKAMLGLEFLYDNGVYSYLHELAANGRMACTTINLVSESAKANAIGKVLRDKGFSADSAYWANIGSFFHATRGGVLRSKDDDIYGHEDREFYGVGLHYKNASFYKIDEEESNHWLGYGSQEKRNAMPDNEVPAYERFLQNTSALGGLKTLHMHSHANDKIKYIHRYPLIISEGPLRRLPEQVEARKNARDTNHPDWQARIGDEAKINENDNSR